MQEQEINEPLGVALVGGQTLTSLQLYATAKNYLGVSLVPAGDDPEYGCAISVNICALKAWGHQIGGGASTYNLLQDLISSFTEVLDPFPGDIIISATGTSTDPNPAIPNGHVGIVGKFGIMSNNSNNGLWEEVYTLETWNQRYAVEGHFPVRFFRSK